MAKISKIRKAKHDAVVPLIRWSNGVIGWRSLKTLYVLVGKFKAWREQPRPAKTVPAWFWERFIKMSQKERDSFHRILQEDILKQPLVIPPDEEFKEAADWLRQTLSRWTEVLVRRPRKAEIIPEYLRLLRQIWETIGSRNGLGGLLDLMIGNERFGPERLGRTLEFLFDFMDSPRMMAQAEAVRLFYLALNFYDDLPVRKCALKSCQLYFIDLSGRGDRRYCSHRCAQQSVNDRRKINSKANRNQGRRERPD